MPEHETLLDKLYEELESREDEAEKLDDLVIDAACSIASAVNNGGLYAQIEFLLEQGVFESEIRAVFND